MEFIFNTIGLLGFTMWMTVMIYANTIALIAVDKFVYKKVTSESLLKHSLDLIAIIWVHVGILLMTLGGVFK